MYASKVGVVAVLILLNVQITSMASVTCPEGWDAVGEGCFKDMEVDTSFEEAKAICSATGAYLPLLNNDEEVETLKGILHSRHPEIAKYFVAATDQLQEGAWRQDYPPYCIVRYTNWNNHQPSNGPPSPENCGEMKVDTGLINDVNCVTNIRRVVCHKRKFDDYCHLCPEKPCVENGVVTIQYGKNKYSTNHWRNTDATVTVECNDGYALVPNVSTVPCTHTSKITGDWRGLPMCSEICDMVTAPTNGKVIISENPVFVGTKVTFVCDPGYVLCGKQVLTCTENGYDQSPPTCIRLCDTGTTCRSHCTNQCPGCAESCKNIANCKQCGASYSCPDCQC